MRAIIQRIFHKSVKSVEVLKSRWKEKARWCVSRWCASLKSRESGINWDICIIWHYNKAPFYSPDTPTAVSMSIQGSTRIMQLYTQHCRRANSSRKNYAPTANALDSIQICMFVELYFSTKTANRFQDSTSVTANIYHTLISNIFLFYSYSDNLI